MIFGKTFSEREQEIQHCNTQWAHGIKKFAWRWVKLDDGRTIWLRHYWSYRGYISNVVRFDEAGNASSHESVDPGGIHALTRNYLDKDDDYILWIR